MRASKVLLELISGAFDFGQFQMDLTKNYQKFKLKVNVKPSLDFI